MREGVDFGKKHAVLLLREQQRILNTHLTPHHIYYKLIVVLFRNTTKKNIHHCDRDTEGAEGGHPVSFEQSEKLSKRSACGRRLER